jgi:hypothetical protein
MLGLISFADGSLHFRRSVKRIEAQADRARFFDSVNCYNLKTLNKSFPEFAFKYNNLLQDEPKAIGRWIWKPYLCSEFAKTKGDFLYLDAGSYLNFENFRARERLSDYIRMLDNSPVLAFQIREKQFSAGKENSERFFSREELLNFCDPKKQIEDSNQIEANVIFFRAGEVSSAFFKEVLHVATVNNFFFMRDNREASIQNVSEDLYRYDQSIFSILYKKWNFKLVQNETWFHPNWKISGRNFPIWTTRNRTGVDIFKPRLRDLPEKIEIKYRFWMKCRYKLKKMFLYFRIN